MRKDKAIKIGEEYINGKKYDVVSHTTDIEDAVMKEIKPLLPEDIIVSIFVPSNRPGHGTVLFKDLITNQVIELRKFKYRRRWFRKPVITWVDKP